MNVASRVLVLMAIPVATGLVSACALRSGGGERPGQVLVVLLPDTDTGNVGRVVVSNSAGSTELVTAWASTRVTMARAPQIRMLNESEVKRRFGDVLATLPPPPRHFTLYFRFESEELTEEGQRLVQEVLQAVKSTRFPMSSSSATPTRRATSKRTSSSD